MESWLDPKTIIMCINLFATVAGFMLIKFNDFKHLEKDVIEIKDNQKEQTKKINHIETDVAVLTERTSQLEKSKK